MTLVLVRILKMKNTLKFYKRIHVQEFAWDQGWKGINLIKHKNSDTFSVTVHNLLYFCFERI